ncbi:MAG TPA: TetR family transcriptional regulator [Actinomycetota bacterium]|nr:TetR family transcriptional regulator [Actinomycetota bacterium]
MGAPQPSPAQRRREATRARIREVAVGLFREKGYRGTSVAEIADAADISERTLFRYFPAKRDIIFDRPESYIAPARAFLVGMDPKVPDWHAVQRAFGDLCSYMEANEEEIRLAWKLTRSSPELSARYQMMEDRWSRGLAHGLATRRGDDRPSYADLALTGAAVAVFGIAARRWLREAPGPMTEVAADAFEAFERRILRAQPDASPRP